MTYSKGDSEENYRKYKCFKNNLNRQFHTYCAFLYIPW